MCLSYTKVRVFGEFNCVSTVHAEQNRMHKLFVTSSVMLNGPHLKCIHILIMNKLASCLSSNIDKSMKYVNIWLNMKCLSLMYYIKCDGIHNIFELKICFHQSIICS